MGVPTISSTTPTNGASGVDTRADLAVTFSEAVDTSTVTEGTFTLTDDQTLETIPGAFFFSDSNQTVTFKPTSELRSNRLYTWTIAGSDLSLPAGSVKSSATSDSLVTTTRVTFRVETERFVGLSEITNRTDIDHVAPIREESELALTTGYIQVTNSTPDGFSSDNRNLDEIVVTFSEALDAAGFDEATMFSMEMNPILDLDMFYGNYNDSNPAEPKLYMQDENVPIAMPTGSVAISSNILTWTRDSPTLGPDDHPRLNTFPFNAEVIVTLDSSIPASSNLTLGEDVKIAFTTRIFPKFSGTRTLRLDVGPSLDDFFDDTLWRLILKRSIDAWELSGKTINLENPIQMARLYARWGTVLDAIEIIGLKADLHAGTSKQLGNFRVSFSNRVFKKPIGREATAKEKLDEIEDMLRLKAGSLKPVVANLGSRAANSGQLMFRGVRNWDSMLHMFRSDDIPIANFMRQRKISKFIDQGGTVLPNPLAFFSVSTRDDGYLYLSPPF